MHFFTLAWHTFCYICIHNVNFPSTILEQILYFKKFTYSGCAFKKYYLNLLKNVTWCSSENKCLVRTFFSFFVKHTFLYKHIYGFFFKTYICYINIYIYVVHSQLFLLSCTAFALYYVIFMCTNCNIINSKIH